jgi:hypothetical protein
MSVDPSASFLPEDEFPDDLDPSQTLDVLDARLADPTTDAPDLIVTDDEPPPLGRSWEFDFAARQFVTRRTGVAQTRGLETLRQWCEKALRTDQGSSPIHSDNYGMVRPFDFIGEPQGSLSAADLEQRVQEALTFHPRIVGIENFDMTFDPVEPILYVSFTVVLSDDELLAITDLALP